MNIRIQLPNTPNYRTAEIRDGVSLSLKVRNNLDLETTGRLFEVDLDFAITYENEAAFEFAHIATVTSDISKQVTQAYLEDGVSEIQGEFTLKGAEVTACDQVQYFGTFATEGARWYSALKNLCQYDLGNATQSADAIVPTFQNGAWQAGSNPLFYHSIYYTKPQVTNGMNVLEMYPSVFIRAILNPIFQQIQSLGFTIDAPFFDTIFFRNLLFHKFAGWDKLQNIYASDVVVKASYYLLDNKPNGLNIYSTSGEFMPYDANSGYNEQVLNIQQNTPNLISEQNTHPTVGTPLQFCGNYNNATNGYVRFIAPITAYYRIKCRYFGGKSDSPTKRSGFMIYKNNNPFYTQIGGGGQGYFDETIDVNVLLQQGDIVMWARHEVDSTDFCYRVYRSGREFSISFEKINTVVAGSAFKISSLLPCDKAQDLFKGLFTLFNLVVSTKDNQIIIEPFSTVQLLTGETVEGFYRLPRAQSPLTENRMYKADFSDSNRSGDYFFSYKDDSNDANIQKGQLFSNHILYPDSNEPQKRQENSYFAPTFSKDGTCYLIDKTIATPNNQWGGADFDHTPRILYRHGNITKQWTFDGVQMGFMPTAFMADTELDIAYLSYDERSNELGITQRFWKNWAEFVQNAVSFQFEHSQVLYSLIDMRNLVYMYGRWWLIDEVTNIRLGCENNEFMTVKILTYNP